MAIIIQTINDIEPDTLKAIITGYTSDAKFRVNRIESETMMGFTLELVALNPPFVKVYEPMDAETFEEHRSALQQGLSFGVYDNGQLVGIALAHERGWNRSLWVGEFHIAESHRDRGLGHMLMKRVMAEGKPHGLRLVGCETQTTNVPAIRFYRRMGFRLEGIDLSLYTNNDWPDGEIAIFLKRALE
jgi:ribosomal protein S18 acetylase RimI-like enzyme